MADPGSGAFAGATSHSYYYLDGVDVAGGRSRGTVVAFGDSISNGHNSTVGASARYSDVLAGRLAAAHIPLGVANAGITGNLLLSQVPCFGEAGLARFRRDALGPARSPYRHLAGGHQRHLGQPEHPGLRHHPRRHRPAAHRRIPRP